MAASSQSVGVAQQQESEGDKWERKESQEKTSSSSPRVRGASLLPTEASPRPQKCCPSRVEWPLFESPSISRLQVTGFEINNGYVVSGRGGGTPNVGLQTGQCVVGVRVFPFNSVSLFGFSVSMYIYTSNTELHISLRALTNMS